VSQISPPIRILLVLSVALMGAYMLFLRPKPEEAPPVEPAGTTVTQPGTVDTAEPAVGTAPATKADEKPAQAGAAATAGDDLKGLPKPLREAIREEKVLVVLFSNGKSYDDKAVEKELTKVNRWDGRVYVHTAPLAKISRYGRIARGVNVEQSPTVVVADRTLRAETLVGFVDRNTIDQAVLDARRNTSGLYVDAYLKAADKVCFEHSNRWASIPFYYVAGPKKADRRLRSVDAAFASFVADYKAIDAPKKWTGFHKTAVAELSAYGTMLHDASVAISPSMKRSAYAAEFAELDRTEAPLAKSANQHFKGANLLRCGSQF